jgi:nucleoid DNA-binding protein
VTYDDLIRSVASATGNTLKATREVLETAFDAIGGSLTTTTGW